MMSFFHTTLLASDIFLSPGMFEDDFFLFPRWDLSVPWRVSNKEMIKRLWVDH